MATTVSTHTYRFRPVGWRALRRERFWKELKLRRFRDLGEVRAYQLRQLRGLVRHAWDTVPFYRARFREVGLEPGDVRSFDDFRRIPPLTRADVVAHLEDMWSRRYVKADLLLLGTGGSTGVPMLYYKDVNYLDRCQVVLSRSHAWAGRGRWDLLALFGSKREPAGVWGALRRRARAWTEHRLFFDSFGADVADFEEWARILDRYRPPFAYGYPSMLDVFCRWCSEQGRRLPPFRGLFVSAETLYPHQREVLSEVFRAPVFNLYGSREVQNVAATCAAGRMHQVADWVFAEFLPEEGLPAPRLVLTPLESFGMPLIRYLNDDLASPAEGQCSCGLAFPLMNLDITRVVDVFVTPEGKRIYGQFFTHLMFGVVGIKQFQFHQTAPDRIRLQVVKGRGYDVGTEAHLQRVIAEVHAKASAQITVRIELVDDIPRTAIGKHIFTRSDVLQRAV